MISTDSKKLRYRDEAAPVQAVQLQEEFTRLLGLFEQARPQRVLEIGGYQKEYFISHTPEVQELADAKIDLEAMRQ